MVAKGVIVGLALLALVDRCLCLSCYGCKEDLVCGPPPTCSYGLTIFPCGCCQKCAKGPGEYCNTNWSDGNCGDGLECEKDAMICKDGFCGCPNGCGSGTCVAREVIEYSRQEGPAADGSYSFLFGSSDGIRRDEKGYPQGDDGAIVQEGSYSFRFPDGRYARFKYIADANGFRVESPLLPTPPPMPPHALAQIENAKS